MYVIRRQQLFPEGDPVDYRDGKGALHLFRDKFDAERAADGLRADPHNKGWRFLVEPVPPGDKRLETVAESREFQV